MITNSCRCSTDISSHTHWHGQHCSHVFGRNLRSWRWISLFWFASFNIVWIRQNFGQHCLKDWDHHGWGSCVWDPHGENGCWQHKADLRSFSYKSCANSAKIARLLQTKWSLLLNTLAFWNCQNDIVEMKLSPEAFGVKCQPPWVHWVLLDGGGYTPQWPRQSLNLEKG